jgi:hypothetical protein
MIRRTTTIRLLTATLIAGTIGGGAAVVAAGPQEPHAALLVSYQPRSNPSAVVEHPIAGGLRFGLSSVPTFVPELRVDLPSPGTYLISGTIRGALMQSASHDCVLTAQLVQGSPQVALPSSRRMVVHDVATPDTESTATAPIETVLTTTAPNTVVRVSAFARNSMGFGCAGAARILSDANGPTTLHARRIN